MKMYVSNLGFHVSDADLQKLFESFGTVTSAKVIIDRESGRSRGFGFVEMVSEGEANKAMGGLNGKEVEGRSMAVSVAKERERGNNQRRW